jgi:hypothetical protein
MALNMSTVIQHIESELGASHRMLELLQDQMVQTVKKRTLVTFSQYFPHLATHVVDETKDRVDPAITGRYYIKTEEWEVLGVAKMVVDSVTRGIVGGYPLYGIFDDPFDRQINADVRSMIEEPITWVWVPPNVIELNQKWVFGGNFTLELKTVHPDTLHTIPLTYTDEFLDLATADVKAALYNIRSQFQSINSPFGQIELNVDDLKQGKDDRATIVANWRANFLKQARRRKIWSA